VVEDAVEDDPDADLVGMLDEVLPVLLGAEGGIDLRVVLRVVRVVRAGVEDRVEIDRVDAGRLEDLELLVDALEIAAVVVAPARLLLGRAVGRWGRVEPPRAVRRGVGVVAAIALGLDAPRQLHDRIVVPDRAGRQVVADPAVAEPVGEDLVDHGVRRPGRGAEARLAEHQRPRPVDRVVRRRAKATVEGEGVVVVVVGIGPVGDDESVPQVVRTEATGQGRLPQVAAFGGEGGFVARHPGGGAAHRDDALAAVLDAVDARLDAGHVVGERPEPERDRGAGLDRAAGRSVEGVAGVVAEAVPLDVVVGPVASGDRQDVGRGVVGEGDLGAGSRDREHDVGATGHPALAVVLVPGLVDRDLGLVGTGGQVGRLEGVLAVTVDVLKPGPEAARIPVARAAERRLEVAGGHGDDARDVVGHPVRVVVVVELDALARAEAEGDVGPAGNGVGAVVLIPAVIEGDLVFVVPGGKREGALPDIVVRVVGEVGGGAARVPIAGATGLALEVADERDGGRVGGVAGAGGGRSERARRGERCQHGDEAQERRDSPSLPVRGGWPGLS
jgi:hypothetical protein